MDLYVQKAQNALAQMNRVILGKEKETREVLLALLANGHVLLEDIPGVGKTTLAMAVSKVLQLDFKRVQFTPDVMPADLTGFSLYKKEADRFVYQEGSVFCNLFLADEINRASAKTQSALLEVMEERKVSVEGVTRPVPEPFLVIATQNPYGSAGTHPLPEAQIDRFMIVLTMGYPAFAEELLLAKSMSLPVQEIEPVASKEELLCMQKQVQDIFVQDEVYRYLVELVTATRTHPSIALGASPRATLALVRMAKAAAWLEGRTFVIPSDVAEQFFYVVSHRVTLNPSARMEGLEKRQILQSILEQVKKPPVGKGGV